MLQDHDGDGGAAAARLPLHRSQPHCEGADPLNGAPRPESQRCVQTLQLRPRVLHPAAIRDSGSDIFLQMSAKTKLYLDDEKVTDWQKSSYLAERMFTFVTSL